MSARQDEFERVAIPHARSLLRTARRLTSSVHAAEDLVQETLLLAWRGFHRFRPESNARAWLFRILLNAFHAQGRKSRAMPDVVPLAGDPPFGGDSFDEAVEIVHALEALEPDHRTVLMLGVVEGFTCREMAEILSLPIGTVMSRLSRARNAMRAQLERGLAKEACAGRELE